MIIAIGFLNQSCDPAHKVSISNQTESEITVRAKKTSHFWNDTLKTQMMTEMNNENWIEFKIKPKKVIDCGMTIGGLKHHLPFSELIILTKKDTLKAENENQVMSLFDRTFLGNLKTPFVLTVD